MKTWTNHLIVVITNNCPPGPNPPPLLSHCAVSSCTLSHSPPEFPLCTAAFSDVMKHISFLGGPHGLNSIISRGWNYLIRNTNIFNCKEKEAGWEGLGVSLLCGNPNQQNSRGIIIVKPKSSPKSKSQIQVPNRSPKSKIKSPKEKEWDWGWHYNLTGHHPTPPHPTHHQELFSP